MALRYGDGGACRRTTPTPCSVTFQVGPPQVSGARAILRLALGRDKRKTEG